MLHTGIDSIDKKLAPVLCLKLKDFRVLNFELPDTETCLGVAESLTILSQPGIGMGLGPRGSNSVYRLNLQIYHISLILMLHEATQL